MAGPRSLIWVWSVARLTKFSRCGAKGCMFGAILNRARCDRRDWRRKRMVTEECSVTDGERTDRGLRGLESPFFVQEVDPLLT